jgi:hypothetical protein
MYDNIEQVNDEMKIRKHVLERLLMLCHFQILHFKVNLSLFHVPVDFIKEITQSSIYVQGVKISLYDWTRFEARNCISEPCPQE